MNPAKIAAYRKLYEQGRNALYPKHVCADVNAMLDAIEALQSPSAPEPVTDGWTLIDSVHAAQTFSGKWVEVDAPAVARLCGEHPLHERICQIAHDPDQPTQLKTDKSDSIHWQVRGNVKLREVPNPETPKA